VLLDSGADIDAASIPNGGMTPLMQAAIAGRETVVDLLLDRRADMDQSNANGYSALI
jgi:ankyrin repeat protein